MHVTMSWVISVCLGVGLIWIEFALSKRKSWVCGLIPIVALLVVFLGLGIHSNLRASQCENVTDSYAMQNGMNVEMSLKLDKNDEVICFSDIRIIDSDGNERDEAIVSFQNDQTICRYLDAANHFQNKYALDGDSLPRKQVESNVAFYGDTSISPNYFFRIGIILSIPLILIYACSRILIKKTQLRNELREMGLKFL